jgi:Protein of unknown function (DUF742)
VTRPATRPDETRPERIYVITGGRSGPSPQNKLDLITLIVARGHARPGLQPEHRAILRMCSRPLSAAEISAYLRLPFSAAAVLVADLLAYGLVEERKPVRYSALPDQDLLKAVIRGLQQL